METTGDPIVNYSTKELLARIEQNTREGMARLEVKVDALMVLLGNKADKAELVTILQRLSVVESYQERAILTEQQRNVPLIAKGEKYMERVDELTRTPIVTKGEEYMKKVDELVQTSVTLEVLVKYKKWLVGALVAAIGSGLSVASFVLAHVKF